MIRSRQYGSLTGARTFQLFPSDNEVVSVDDENYLAIPLQEAKKVLRVKTDADDVFIESLIRGVTDQIERHIGRDIQPKVRLAYWSRPNFYVKLTHPPVNEIVSVVNVDEDGNEEELASDSYTVTGLAFDRAIHFSQKPHILKVQYECGYAKCPDAVKAAIHQELALQYKNRNDPNSPQVVSVNGLSIEARHLLVSGGYYEYAR